MSDSSHKRSNSFRKLFPSLFFSSKAKEKSHKHSSVKLKKSTTEKSNSNQYENPRTVSVSGTNPDIGRIYENLAVGQFHGEFNSSSNNVSSSNHSSSSTLVSESIKMCQNGNLSHTSTINDIARPQVPRKPCNELPPSKNIDHKDTFFHKNQYPDVYYHSVEKLIERISPLEEIEIYRAVESNAKPASVGAEIKRVSTKFLISPKKEAEVRTIQPTRARSFSFENKNKCVRNSTLDKHDSNCADNIKKSYNYSAPTSPIPTNHKIPNMPKTISPYGHVRKSINESEEKKSSLNRTSLEKRSERITTAPVQMRESNDIPRDRICNEDIESKEKARYKLEAFYWQKLRELKQKEDEYLLKQSFNTSLKSPASNYGSIPKHDSSAQLLKTNSLPREISPIVKSTYTSSSFLRGGPERRTDTFIRNKGYYADVDVIYRHPEKLHWTHNITADPLGASPLPLPQSGPLKQDIRSLSLQPKRVSFEEKYYDDEKNNVPLEKLSFSDDTRSRTVNERSNRIVPPRPPVRTTSANRGSKIIKYPRMINPTSASRSLYSESESGSEAGEVQRILHSTMRKSTNGKQFFPELELTAVA